MNSSTGEKMAVWTVPLHVPADLVVDIDIFKVPGGSLDPHTAWRSFQGKGPLVFSPYNGGHWLAVNGSDIYRFLRDTEHFSSRQVAIPHPGSDVLLPVQADLPDHTQHRANVQSLFSPTAVEVLDEDIRNLTTSLIDGLLPKGGCEFVSDFALQLPLTIFLKMMGLPLADRLILREQVEIFNFNPDPAAKIEAHRVLHEYLSVWIDRRIAEPGTDGLTAVTRATFNGRPYSRDEMLATLTLLLHAGLDTVANMMSFIALHLARHPDQREYIRNNKDRMQFIVQELFRRFAGPNLARVLASDYSYKGVLMKIGDVILFPISLFNMDKDTLENPDEVDLNRSARHITFGAGPHTCAGALLARREITIFVDQWLTRIPEFEVDPDRAPELAALQQNSVMRLWLRWPKQA